MKVGGRASNVHSAMKIMVGVGGYCPLWLGWIWKSPRRYTSGNNCEVVFREDKLRGKTCSMCGGQDWCQRKEKVSWVPASISLLPDWRCSRTSHFMLQPLLTYSPAMLDCTIHPWAKLNSSSGFCQTFSPRSNQLISIATWFCFN